MMNELLLDSIRHNSWATNVLIGFCQQAGLTDEQLATPGSGTYGGILATLKHVVGSDAAYARAVLDQPHPEQVEPADLAELAVRAEASEGLWKRVLVAPIDVERVIVVDGGANEVRAGVFIAQALHHGNHHREQVCATLTALGFEPPDIQAWEYAWVAGRLWERGSPSGR